MGACVRKTATSTADSLKKKATLDPLSDPTEKDPPGLLSSRVRNLVSPMAMQALEPLPEEILSAVELPKQKSIEDIALLQSTLKAHSVFSGLSENVHKVLIEEMRTVRVPANCEVVHQDKHGSNFYIIKSGTAAVSVNGDVLRSLSSGQSFGELALLQNTKRTATVTASTELVLWVLEQTAFKAAVRAVSALYYRETRAFINKVPLFDSLSFKQKDALLDVVVPLKFASGDKIAGEGEPGHMLFIVTAGEVDLLLKSSFQKKVTRGQVFSEQAIYHPQFTHRTTALAATDGSLLTLNRTQALNVLGPQMETILMRSAMEACIAGNRTMRKLTTEAKERLIGMVSVRHFEPQAMVFKRGERLGACFYMVLEGALRTSSSLFAQCFDCIGEEEVSMGNPTTSIIEDVIAGEETLLGVVSKEQFQAATSLLPIVGSTNSEASICLRKVNVFKTVKTAKLTAMASVLKPQTYDLGMDIVVQGEHGSALFLIRSGTVEILINNSLIRTLGKFDYFGERSLILNEPRGATVKAKTSVSVFMLEQDDLNRVLDERIRDELVKSVNMEQMVLSVGAFRIVTTIEKTLYGSTFLIVDISNGMKLVVSVLTRKRLQASGRLPAINESLLLHKSLENPLLSRLYKVIKDGNRLYIVKEFVAGVSLDRVIYDNGKLNEGLVRFYIGNLVLALEFMHDRGVLHRGLASEHVIIDENGYPKVCDFEYAKRVDGRTNTVVGLPHFMAPEVILGQYYGAGADFWSVGVLLFEMTQGRVPFGSGAQTPIEVYEDILKHKKAKIIGSPSLSLLINSLLDPNPASRCNGGLDGLKQAEWFSGFPWEEIMTQEAVPSLTPKARNMNRETQKALGKTESLPAFLTAEEAKEGDQDFNPTEESTKLWNSIEGY